MTVNALNVTAALQIAPGADKTMIQSQALTAIASYFASMSIGTTFIFNDLVMLIMEIAGVVDVVITAPTANHTASTSQVVGPGTITVTTP